MTSHLPPLTPTEPNIYRDVSEKVFVKLYSIKDNVDTPIPIKGNTNSPYKRRNVEFKINGRTSEGREVEILAISLKILFAATNFDSTLETFLDDAPITPNGNGAFTKEDLIDTIVDLINRYDSIHPFN